jgi:hypothetical protein
MEKKKPPTLLKASVVDMDLMVRKMFGVLLKQNNYLTTFFGEEMPEMRKVRDGAKDLLLMNLDPHEDRDVEKFRTKTFRDLLRSQDLANCKILLISSQPEDEKIKSIAKLNKLDGIIALPLDAMDLTNKLKGFKDNKPVRVGWRGSGK